MKNIFWTGFSNDERHSAISTITGIINKHGYLVDFKPFSDIALSMVIEVEEARIDTLYDDLAAILPMKPFDPLGSLSPRERTVYLNITFIQGRGDVTQEIPSIPG